VVNVPPATIHEPTWAIAYTTPPSRFGVKLAGTELTTWFCWTDSPAWADGAAMSPTAAEVVPTTIVKARPARKNIRRSNMVWTLP
jgi:hypothetical protein